LEEPAAEFDVDGFHNRQIFSLSRQWII
jgi:hypothetical protein